jgi:Ca2+-binding RTX toxin-like protein
MADTGQQPRADRLAATGGWISDGLRTGVAGLFTQPTAGRTQFAVAGQHGPSFNHLPAVRENVDLIGKLELETPAQFRFDPVTGMPDPTEPGMVEGQIADVSIYKNAAYLASWSEPTCRRGGFFSVDITDPRNPQQLAFVPALPGTYHGEGTHTITLDTAAFQGDVLAVNNEPCAANGVGGFDLYDVSDPANPEILVQGAGDQSPDDTTETQDPAAVPNSAHSIFIWQHGEKAYAVIVDNTEFHDTDIFDITDPRNPVFIGDHDLIEIADEQGVDVIDNLANGNTVFLHDMVVKEIGGVPIMLASYWDSGYIKLDVTDPADPQIIGDSAFDDNDPLVEDPTTNEGFAPPEGNGHQSEFSHDNRYVLAADEDFSQFRFVGRVSPGTPEESRFFVAGQPDEGPLVTPDTPLEGDTRFIGLGCDPATIAPATADVKIAVAERGSCNFQVKVENAEAQGYTAVIIFNSSNGAPPCDQLLNMDFTNYAGDAVALFVGRSVGFRLIGAFDPATYACTGNAATSTPAPAAPREGNPLEVSVRFDGWGYVHLYDNSGDDLTAVDHFAIEEGIDPRFATGFGDLSVHEFATDPNRNLAYSSYYAGGVRVFGFGPGGLGERGKFIDKGGNNFWGIEYFDSPVEGPLLAASDRDFGLYLLRYTGPASEPVVAPPECDNLSEVTIGAPVRITLSCTDPDDAALTYRLAEPRATGGSVSEPEDGAVTYTPRADFVGEDTFRYTATNGDREAVPATVRVRVIAAPLVTPAPQPAPAPAETTRAAALAGPCANDLIGTAARDLVRGTAAGERFAGGAGNDVADGGGGDDCLSGDAGNDDLSGDDGNDDLAGGSGRDDLVGGAGADDLEGGTGDDELAGGTGNDRLSGGSGRDRLSGGSGADTIRGGAGRDTILARGGGRDTIDCGSGRDTVTADARDRVARNCEVVRRR